MVLCIIAICSIAATRAIIIISSGTRTRTGSCSWRDCAGWSYCEVDCLGLKFCRESFLHACSFPFRSIVYVLLEEDIHSKSLRLLDTIYISNRPALLISGVNVLRGHAPAIRDPLGITFNRVCIVSSSTSYCEIVHLFRVEFQCFLKTCYLAFADRRVNGCTSGWRRCSSNRSFCGSTCFRL